MSDGLANEESRTRGVDIAGFEHCPTKGNGVGAEIAAPSLGLVALGYVSTNAVVML